MGEGVDGNVGQHTGPKGNETDTSPLHFAIGNPRRFNKAEVRWPKTGCFIKGEEAQSQTGQNILTRNLADKSREIEQWLARGKGLGHMFIFIRGEKLESVCQRRSQQGGQAEDSREQTSLTQRVLGTHTWGAGGGNPVLTEMVRWGPEERGGVGL